MAPDHGGTHRCAPRVPRVRRWCWSPQVGFHDRADPQRPVRLRVGAALLPGGRAVSARQAAGLGAGGPLPPVAAGFCGLDQWVRFDDAAPFARLGHAVSRASPPPGDHLVRHALSLIDPDRIPPPWRAPLAAATADGPVPATVEAVHAAAYQRLTRFHDGWPPPRLDRQAWWDYAVTRTCLALRDHDWAAAAAAVADLFGQVGPDPEQAVAWLDAISARAADQAETA
ncbi:hypothetical protein Cs7R123_49630 [Catellatospora sp. TT07R-123]|uniref:hypothetical protein n=1 Tax=Catellatospora sp. TT07R-123 TaxID=2733863 RepID=UPI001B223D24|nr:hypothetical protein [Catellatospora sp. TT07R-123]GHJ47621.1 hypothetical protein Cs7R123_49630 [Catellatospora sp. TT07R-123]